MESGYYPPGAEHDSNAPYNQVDSPKEEVEVLVSVTLSKTVKVQVDDPSECNLLEAVKNQTVLPQEAYYYVKTNTRHGSKAYEDLIGWNVDEIEVIKE